MGLQVSLLNLSLSWLALGAPTVITVRDDHGACGFEMEAICPPSDWHQCRRPYVPAALIRTLPGADGRGHGI
jgi:hypothetical protein